MKQTLSVTRSPGRSSSFGLDLLRGPNLPQNEPPETRVERAHVPLPAETPVSMRGNWLRRPSPCAVLFHFRPLGLARPGNLICKKSITRPLVFHTSWRRRPVVSDPARPQAPELLLLALDALPSSDSSGTGGDE